MNRLKVLYIITKTDVGGAQKYVSDLALHLDKNRFSSKILYGGEDIKWLSNRIWWWAFFINDWFAIVELVRVFRRERPDIIHLNSSKAGVIGSLAAAVANLRPTANNQQRMKVVFTAHGWVFQPANRISFGARIFYLLLHAGTAFFQDTIICVSEYDRALAERLRVAPARKLAVVWNGIDADIPFLAREEARREIFSKLTADHQRRTANQQWIGSIGRLTKEKDFETFIRAAAILCKKRNAAFFIIGEGGDRAQLSALIAQFDLQESCFLIGRVTDAPLFLRAFDVFLAASRKEGMPYTILEAMAAGLPIVATDAGGVPEAVRSEKEGLVVSKQNPQAIADALDRLLEDANLMQALAGAAAARLKSEFTISRMMRKTESVYDILTGGYSFQETP